MGVREFFSFFHGNVRVLVVCRAMWNFSTQIPAPFLSLYILALGGSAVDIGAINALAAVGGMLVEPIGGLIADRRGRVKLIGTATYFYALSWIFYFIAQDWRVLGIGIILHQMALFYTPALNALLADSLPPGTRGRGFALERAFPAVLGIVAPYIGGLAITYYGGGDEGVIQGLRICYMAALLVCALVATLRRFFLKETISVDANALSIRKLPDLIKESYGSILETVKWMPSFFRPIVYLQIIQSFCVSAAAPFWILYATEVWGLTALNWGTIQLFAGIFGALMIMPAGYLVDRYGSRPVILYSISLASISAFLFLFAPTFLGAFLGTLIVVILLTLSNIVVMPSFASLIANMIRRDRRGRVYALIGEQGIQVSLARTPGGGILLVVPASIGGFLGGYLYTVNPSFPFIVLTISLLLALFVAYRLVREPKEAEI